MADININSLSFYPFSAGDVPTGDQVSEVLYHPRVTPDTFEVMNGHLSRANLASSALPLDKALIRKGALSRGGQVMATLNADYPTTLFRGIPDQTALLDDDVLDVEAIPVVAYRYYLPEAVTFIRLMWRLGFIHDTGHDSLVYDSSEIDDFEARVRLFVDGAAVRPVTRDIKAARTSTTQPVGLAIAWAPDTRWWSGSYVLDGKFTEASPLAKGWHTVSLRVGAVLRGKTSTNNCLLRVRARMMGYTSMK